VLPQQGRSKAAVGGRGGDRVGVIARGGLAALRVRLGLHGAHQAPRHLLGRRLCGVDLQHSMGVLPPRPARERAAGERCGGAVGQADLEGEAQLSLRLREGRGVSD